MDYIYSIEFLVKTILLYDEVGQIPKPSEIITNFSFANKFNVDIQRDTGKILPSTFEDNLVTKNPDNTTIKINAGRCVAFPIKQAELSKLIDTSSFNIAVYTKIASFGKCVLKLDINDYIHLINAKPEDDPKEKRKEAEEILYMMEGDKKLGIIEVYIRLTNYGPKVDTQFQIDDPNDKQPKVFFKNSRYTDAFQLEAAGGHPTEGVLPTVPLVGGTDLGGQDLKPIFITPFSERASVMVSAFKMMADKSLAEAEEMEAAEGSRGSQKDYIRYDAPKLKCEGDLTPAKIRNLLCGHSWCPVAQKFRDLGIGPFAPVNSGLGAINGRETPHISFGMSQMYGTMDCYGPYGLLKKKSTKCPCIGTEIKPEVTCDCKEDPPRSSSGKIRKNKPGKICMESPVGFVPNYVPKMEHCKSRSCKRPDPNPDPTCDCTGKVMPIPVDKISDISSCDVECCPREETPGFGCDCEPVRRSRGGADVRIKTDYENDINQINTVKNRVLRRHIKCQVNCHIPIHIQPNVIKLIKKPKNNDQMVLTKVKKSQYPVNNYISCTDTKTPSEIKKAKKDAIIGRIESDFIHKYDSISYSHSSLDTGKDTNINNIPINNIKNDTLEDDTKALFCNDKFDDTISRTEPLYINKHFKTIKRRTRKKTSFEKLQLKLAKYNIRMRGGMDGSCGGHKCNLKDTPRGCCGLECPFKQDAPAPTLCGADCCPLSEDFPKRQQLPKSQHLWPKKTPEYIPAFLRPSPIGSKKSEYEPPDMEEIKERLERCCKTPEIVGRCCDEECCHEKETIDKKCNDGKVCWEEERGKKFYGTISHSYGVSIPIMDSRVPICQGGSAPCGSLGPPRKAAFYEIRMYCEKCGSKCAREDKPYCCARCDGMMIIEKYETCGRCQLVRDEINKKKEEEKLENRFLNCTCCECKCDDMEHQVIEHRRKINEAIQKRKELEDKYPLWHMQNFCPKGCGGILVKKDVIHVFTPKEESLCSDCDCIEKCDCADKFAAPYRGTKMESKPIRNIEDILHQIRCETQQIEATMLELNNEIDTVPKKEYRKRGGCDRIDKCPVLRMRGGSDDKVCGGNKCYLQQEPCCCSADCDYKPNGPTLCNSPFCPMTEGVKPKKNKTLNMFRKKPKDFEPFYLKYIVDKFKYIFPKRKPLQNLPGIARPPDGCCLDLIPNNAFVTCDCRCKDEQLDPRAEFTNPCWNDEYGIGYYKNYGIDVPVKDHDIPVCQGGLGPCGRRLSKEPDEKPVKKVESNQPIDPCDIEDDDEKCFVYNRTDTEKSWDYPTCLGGKKRCTQYIEMRLTKNQRLNLQRNTTSCPGCGGYIFDTQPKVCPVCGMIEYPKVDRIIPDVSPKTEDKESDLGVLCCVLLCECKPFCICKKPETNFKTKMETIVEEMMKNPTKTAEILYKYKDDILEMEVILESFKKEIPEMSECIEKIKQQAPEMDEAIQEISKKLLEIYETLCSGANVEECSQEQKQDEERQRGGCDNCEESYQYLEEYNHENIDQSIKGRCSSHPCCDFSFIGKSIDTFMHQPQISRGIFPKPFTTDSISDFSINESSGMNKRYKKELTMENFEDSKKLSDGYSLHSHPESIRVLPSKSTIKSKRYGDGCEKNKIIAVRFLGRHPLRQRGGGVDETDTHKCSGFVNTFNTNSINPNSVGDVRTCTQYVSQRTRFTPHSNIPPRNGNNTNDFGHDSNFNNGCNSVGIDRVVTGDKQGQLAGGCDELSYCSNVDCEFNMIRNKAGASSSWCGADDCRANQQGPSNDDWCGAPDCERKTKKKSVSNKSDKEKNKWEYPQDPNLCSGCGGVFATEPKIYISAPITRVTDTREPLCSRCRTIPFPERSQTIGPHSRVSTPRTTQQTFRNYSTNIQQPGDYGRNILGNYGVSTTSPSDPYGIRSMLGTTCGTPNAMTCEPTSCVAGDIHPCEDCFTLLNKKKPQKPPCPFIEYTHPTCPLISGPEFTDPCNTQSAETSIPCTCSSTDEFDMHKYGKTDQPLLIAHRVNVESCGSPYCVYSEDINKLGDALKIISEKDVCGAPECPFSIPELPNLCCTCGSPASRFSASEELDPACTCPSPEGSPNGRFSINELPLSCNCSVCDCDGSGGKLRVSEDGHKTIVSYETTGRVGKNKFMDLDDGKNPTTPAYRNFMGPCDRQSCKIFNMQTCPECGGITISGATCKQPNIPFDPNKARIMLDGGGGTGFGDEDNDKKKKKEKKEKKENDLNAHSGDLTKDKDKKEKKEEDKDKKDKDKDKKDKDKEKKEKDKEKKEIEKEKKEKKKEPEKPTVKLDQQIVKPGQENVKKPNRFIYKGGKYYPGIRVGHKVCNQLLRNVPAHMGWLWNTPPVGRLKKRPWWKPGEMNKIIQDRIRARRAELGIPDPPELKMLVNKKKTKAKIFDDDEESEDEIEPRPTLKIHKEKDGTYYITLNPLKNPATLAPREDPYMNCTPMQFVIKTKKPKPVINLSESSEKTENSESGSSSTSDRCECKEEKEDVSSSESELDIEFTPPAGLIYPELFERKPNIVHTENQYNDKDLTDPDLPTINATSKKSKKKKRYG